MAIPTIKATAEPEEAFLAALPLIERIITTIVRRHALDAADGEEFRSWAESRIIESNYAPFRKYSGKCSMPTYLTVVVSNLFRDYRNSQWGRWHPSAEAMRRGPIAVRLEVLLYRDGLPLRDAAQLLISSGVQLKESDFARLAASFPARRMKSQVALDDVPLLQPEAISQDPELTEEERSPYRAVEEALRSLVDSLAPEDAIIMRMRFWDNIPLSDIARILHLEQRPLYRRLDRVKAELRVALEARGVDRALASEILNGDYAS